MWRLAIVAVLLVGCATPQPSPQIVRQQKLKACVTEMLELEVAVKDAVEACVRIHNRKTIRSIY